MEDRFVGKRLDGRYEIHQLVGAGGMAHVYKAYDNQEERWVAVKILKAEYANNVEFLRRFKNESKAISMLSQENIVKVYDMSFGDRIQYIVMEYISGITLKDYITRNGVLPWKDMLYFTYQILKALQHAHEKGVVHRDIKPQNIIMLKDGKIKVTDFGIARLVQNDTQTMTDKAFGSVHYISPEQARGDYTNNKADLYSLGVMMYEMLTGKLPFDAENAVSVALMQLQSTAQSPRSINPEIPVGLEEITVKAMEKNPALRFQSAQVMLEDLEKFRQNPDIVFNYEYDLGETKQVEIPIDAVKAVPLPARPVQTKQPEPIKEAPVYNDHYEYEEELVRSKKQAKSSMVITGIFAAIVIALVGFGIYLVWDYTQQEPEEEVVDEVEVPSFVGMNYYDEIEGNVKYDDFTFLIVETYDDEKELGEVTRQSPSSGITVKIGKEITLYVVSEEDLGDMVAIPSTEGKSETEAYNLILSLGLVPSVLTVNNEYTDAGDVISTEPAAGVMVDPGTTVSIYVSDGPTEIPVTVPSLVGETLETAKALIESAGLKVGDVLYDETSEEDLDIVVSTSKDAGDRVSEGTSIDIVVSSGSKSSKIVSAYIPLPSGVTQDVTMKIYLDGALYESAITINPALISSYTIDFVGSSGTKQVVVYLNDTQYIFATLEFDSENGSFTLDTVYDLYIGDASTDDTTDDTTGEA